MVEKTAAEVKQARRANMQRNESGRGTMLQECLTLKQFLLGQRSLFSPWPSSASICSVLAGEKKYNDIQ